MSGVLAGSPVPPKATVYLTCPCQCSACKLQTHAQMHTVYVEQQHVPLRAPLRRHGPALSPDPTQRPHGTNYTLFSLCGNLKTRPGASSDITLYPLDRTCYSWKLGLQWKPFWPEQIRPTNCCGDCEELSTIHPDIASSWERERQGKKKTVSVLQRWSKNGHEVNEQTLQAPFYPTDLHIYTFTIQQW